MNFFTTLKDIFDKDKKSLFQKNSRKKIPLLFSFLLTTSIFYAQGDCSQLPNSISGFIYMGEHNGSKYFCSDNNNHNWLSAKTAAAANGGHLVVINDQSENDFIKNGIMASAAWIGYSDENTEGSFEWLDGSQPSYTNWSSGEPNNQGTSGGQGDYTVIEKSSGQWKDREGSDQYEYVMEIPCPTPPTGPCMNQLAYWNLNACSPGSSYNELTASTSSPNGFSNVSATILSNNGDHSCSPSPYDKGICHAIRDYCSFSNNHSNAYKFSVTIKPQNGFTASLSKLSFYEAAPTSYNWTSGGSGDNDPPSKYGIRVLANGTEIFKQVDISTSSAWSLEQFDFSNDPDFTVTTQTTFSFELLGYCRQGSLGYAVWDLDEIKVFGCSEGPCANAGGDSDGDGVCDNDDCAPNNPNLPATPGTACDDGNANTTNDVIQADGCSCTGTTPPPCANQGGDSDGDGVCNNQDCAPNDPTLPATPGTACNDGNTNTTNDVIQADGCSCAGTPTGGTPDCENDIDITVGNGTITVTGLDGAPVSSLQIFTCDWSQTITSCFADCGATKTVNVAPGCYLIYAKYYTAGYSLICEKQATVTVDGNDPCANAGGDSDGDGVCNNDDCQPNNPAFPATPGTPCNDGNPNTTNDVVQTDGCSCAGTPVQGCDNITDGGTIGFDPNCLASVSVACNSTAPNIANCVSPTGGSGNLEIIWLKSTTSCNAPTTTADDIIAGLDPHWVLVSGQTGLSLSPGVVNANTCYLRCTRRAGCSTYQESNIISLTTDCGGGNPNCDADISITTNNGTITVTGLDGAPVSSLQIFSCDWSQTITNCFGDCGASKTVNVAPGCYLIYAKYYTAGYQLICEKQATVTVGGNGPCVNAGGDSDGDGVCDNDDCQPNNPSFPATPGTACNDGNPNTANDVVQADGCSCAGAPTGGNPDCENDIDITVSNGTITVTGLDGVPVSSLQIFSCDWSQTITNCFGNCGATKTVNVAPGCYLVYAKYYTAGYQLICEKQATVTVDGNDPCANAGGDSDGDGVCDNDDCQPNNPAFPATPGTPCNDGNPNTENDVVTANGCGCAGTPVNTSCTPTELVRYDMDACHSCSTGSNADWSEFAAAIISNSNCQSVTATGLTPVNSSDNHSCTPGAVNNAMCVGQGTTIQFSVTLNSNNTNRLTGISFYEKAPNTYLWETAGCGSPVSGSNNRPTKFDLKVYKGGSLVFSTTMSTQTSWNLRNVDFSNDPDFVVNGSATYTFKFTPYNALGFGSVKAWDLDEIKVMGCCDGSTDPCAAQGGDNDGDGVCANQDCNDYDATIPAAPGTACNDGNANTINDVIQADGCTCAGTPNNGGTKCKIGDLVWHDTNNDGKHDSNEPGLAGVWINLLDHLGNSKGWKVTGSDGSYLFDDLDPGDYKIKFSTPGGYIPTTQHAGNDPTNDSDIGFWTGMTNIFTLTAGQWQKDCDAGYKSGQYLIGNPKFEFEAVKGEEFAQLYWLHNEGFQVEEYILERSADGNDFTEIYNQVSKGGNGNELYEAFDIEPLTGDNFYRVKMINQDGSIQYSAVKVVNFPDLIDFVLFPNPANDFAKVNLETVVGKKDVTLTIFNNLGVEIKRFQLDEVYSKLYQMDIRELKEGHYIVWLNLPGHKPLAKQLVVGKI